MHCTSICFKLIVGGILTVLSPLAVSGYMAITDSAKALIRFSETNERFIAEGTAMQVVDVALYRAEEEGRNRSVRFTSNMWQNQV